MTTMEVHTAMGTGLVLQQVVNFSVRLLIQGTIGIRALWR